MQPAGIAQVIELYGLEKRVLQSEMEAVGSTYLHYKSINMKRVVACWKEGNSIAMVCETKFHELFAMTLKRNLEIEHIKAHEECLGADINDAYAQGKLILVRDRTRWKYYKLIANGNFQLLAQVDCEKAFIGSEHTFYYLFEQALYIKQVGGGRSDPIVFKYPNADRVHHLFSDDSCCYLLAGTRFFRIAGETVTSAGMAVRTDRA
jgi:hypothetical protein